MALGAPAEPDDEKAPETVAADGLSQTHLSDRINSPATSRAGRLVRRWVPDPLRDARWEPGRPGALALSLVAALAAVIAAVGVWRERPVAEPTPALPLITADTAPGLSAPPPPAAPEVVVSVAGRVARPGLIRLPDGTRVADALVAAGGPLPGTDLMGLNIARRLSDGEHLLIGVAPPPGQPRTAPGRVRPLMRPGRSTSTRRRWSSSTCCPGSARSLPSTSLTGGPRTAVLPRWISSAR